MLQLDPVAETLDSDIQLVRAGFHPDEAAQRLGTVTSLLGTYATLTSQRSDLVVARDQVLTDADDATLAQVVTAWRSSAAGPRSCCRRSRTSATSSRPLRSAAVDPDPGCRRPGCQSAALPTTW